MIHVLAHGVGGRSDLPLPLWLFMYGAAFALLISFVALRILWPRPRLAKASTGRAFPAGSATAVAIVRGCIRFLGLFAFGVVLYAAVAGVDNAGENVAPYALYVGFWVGMQVVSALVGDLYALANPFDTLALLLRIPARTSRTEDHDPGQWTAALLLLSFAWLELAYHTPSSPRVIGVWLSVYTVAVLGGALVWGREWLRYGEGFAALFALLGHIAPVGRDDAGHLRIRAPLSALSTLRLRRGMSAVVFVALGSTTFDGLSRTKFWADIVNQRTGWSATFVATIGIVWTIAMVCVAYLIATRVVARITDEDPNTVATAFIASLVPIAFAYAVAHYFSLLVFDGQNLIALASDPFGRGWDLFGTIDQTVNYRLVSVRTIALVQAGAIVVGHVSGVLVAHDRAVERYRPNLAVRSQYPLLAVMIAYTVGGLAILLGG